MLTGLVLRVTGGAVFLVKFAFHTRLLRFLFGCPKLLRKSQQRVP